jgi:hypothetical protein
VPRRYRIPVTSLVRTLIDRAGTHDQPTLRGEVRQAERLRRLALRTLWDAVASPLADPRKARLRSVLATGSPCRTRRNDDRVRDRRLKAAGYEILRFTWAEVAQRPAAVAREIRAAIRRRRAALGR